jgi:hypothetical protein
MGSQFEVPDETDLIEFFEGDPVEKSVEDGYWCYEITDERGITLRFSFNIYERSVQTVLSVAGEKIETVSHESAEKLTIGGGVLRCEFSLSTARTTLVIDARKRISVTWTNLRSQ